MVTMRGTMIAFNTLMCGHVHDFCRRRTGLWQCSLSYRLQLFSTFPILCGLSFPFSFPSSPSREDKCCSVFWLPVYSLRLSPLMCGAAGSSCLHVCVRVGMCPKRGRRQPPPFGSATTRAPVSARSNRVRLDEWWSHVCSGAAATR